MTERDHEAIVASRLAAIVNSSHDGIISTDLLGTVESWNHGAERLFGYAPAEMIGTNILVLVPPDREAEEAFLLEQIRRGEHVSHFDTARRHKNGRDLDVSVTASPIRDRHGIIIGASKIVRDISERRRADLANSRLAAIVESSHDAIIGKDLDGLVTSWNGGAARIFGYTAAEMIGTSITRLIPADRMGEEDVILGHLRRGDVVAPFETTRVRKDGQTITVSITTSPIRAADGRVVGASKLARDITSQVWADEARRLAEDRYRTLFDCAPDGILVADREGTYLDANPSMCRMVGYSRDELIGMAASELRVAAEAAAIGPAIDALNAGQDVRHEWHFRRKDGSVFPAETIGTVMPDGRLLGLVRDISERIEATATLRAAEERMRFALEAAGVGIWDMDYATGTLRWSAIMEQQHGLAPGSFGGTMAAFAALVHPGDRAETLAAATAAAATGADFTTTYRVTWPDGSLHWLSGAGRVRLGADGAPLRGVGISLDITAHRLLEAQFQQAQKMEALGRLAGGVAHDFNNLLTAILGYCELLLVDLHPDDALRHDVLEIRKAGDQAAGLTRQLLAFSRKQIIEPTRVDLNAIATGMRPLLARVIGEDIVISLGLQADLAPVMADRGQVEQVVMNLAVNARDAMPHGGRLSIETANVQLDEHAATHRALAPGAYVVLRVTDTGVGMTADVQARLFEPFFTTKEVGKGTGLGMATVHGIVARSGGSVGVYSEVGRGSAFSVYFPAAVGSLAADTARPTAAASARAPRVTVLVVDDADNLRRLTKRILERHGHTVLTAADAAEAETVCAAHPDIDVILTDVVMPGTSGPELTARLLAARPNLRVIYMSGYTEDAIGHHGVLEPSVSFLHKPFTAEALALKLIETMGRPPARFDGENSGIP